jgi:hypothetical protein
MKNSTQIKTQLKALLIEFGNRVLQIKDRRSHSIRQRQRQNNKKIWPEHARPLEYRQETMPVNHGYGRRRDTG